MNLGHTIEVQQRSSSEPPGFCAGFYVVNTFDGEVLAGPLTEEQAQAAASEIRTAAHYRGR